MSQWKALAAGVNETSLASTICYCLNFQQGDENPRPKLILPTDIPGELSIIEFFLIDVICDL